MRVNAHIATNSPPAKASHHGSFMSAANGLQSRRFIVKPPPGIIITCHHVRSDRSLNRLGLRLMTRPYKELVLTRPSLWVVHPVLLHVLKDAFAVFLFILLDVLHCLTNLWTRRLENDRVIGTRDVLFGH